jgi:hypothetical protein
MLRMILIAAACTLTFAAAPALASASYTITNGQADRYARIAAETKYSANGVDATGSTCRPQGVTGRNLGYGQWSGRTHRWVCKWVGTDGDYDDVGGFFRVTGHSDGTFGYLALYGGLRLL